jgi:hypothetical protein
MFTAMSETTNQSSESSPQRAARWFPTRHFTYAVRESVIKWESVKLGIFGGGVGGIIFHFLGIKVTPEMKEIIDNPFWGPAIGILLDAAAGVLIVFVLRFLYAIVHFSFEAHGGFRAFLRKRLGRQMWPILLMATGIMAFVLLFGGGAVWFVVKSEKPRLVIADQTPASEAVAKPPKKKWDKTPYNEIENKLLAIDNALKFVNDDLDSIIEQGKWLVGGTGLYYHYQQSPDYPQRLSRFDADVVVLMRKFLIFAESNQNNPDLNYILKDSNKQMQDLLESDKTLVQTAQLIQDLQLQINAHPEKSITYGIQMGYIELQANAFYSGIRKVIAWRDQVHEALIERRSEVASEYPNHPALSKSAPISPPAQSPSVR